MLDTIITCGHEPLHAKGRCRACYHATRREEKMVYNSRCRAKQFGARVDDLTTGQWSAALAYYDHRCAYCGIGDRVGMDHVVPLSSGGDNTIGNVVPACLPCNRTKYKRPVDEFMGAGSAPSGGDQ